MTARQEQFQHLCEQFEEYHSQMREFARRELIYLTALGLIDEAAVSAEDIVDEAILEAWSQRRLRPANTTDVAWFNYAIRCALVRIARQARSTRAGPSLDEIVSNPEMDDQLWAYWEPDEVNTLEDEIADESAPVVEDTALQDIEIENVEEALSTLPALQRDSFRYYLVEGDTLDNVARYLDTSPDVVARAAETARTVILSYLNGR